VHVRALHFTRLADFAALGRELCSLDHAGVVTIGRAQTTRRCVARDLTDTAVHLGALADVDGVLCIAGRALTAGQWTVRLSAAPAHPSTVEAAAGNDVFVRALAGLVSYSTTSRAGDVIRQRPLLPSG
jgi:hypothetical protein